jgi:hypothetical protein
MWPSDPSLYDIFLDEDVLVVVLSFRFAYSHNGCEDLLMMDVAKLYSQGLWQMLTNSGEIVDNTFPMNDPELHTKVLKFPYSRENTGPDVVTIFTHADNADVTYENVPFCRLPPRVPIFASLCTQNYATDKQTMLDWVAWHRLQGFDHASVYINEENGAAQMRGLLGNAIKNGSLTIVDWSWPFAWDFHDQPVTQVSCIHRAKGRSRWIGINDIDEIFVAERGMTVADVLKKYEPIADSIGSIACCNRWFSGSGTIAEITKCAAKCDEHPHRQKNVVRTDNVDYFCTHQINLGLPEQRSVEFELVNGHYGRIRGSPVMTDCDHVSRYKAEIDKWSYDLS